MKCRRCESSKCQKFISESAIHFPGTTGLNQPTLLLCHELIVCLHCGFTVFTVPERELKVLVEGKHVRGAAIVSDGKAVLRDN